MFFQELGMQAFVKMERKLRWRMRLGSYEHAGAQAMKSLGAALSGDKSITGQANVVFVSLDFEGDPLQPKRGMIELGIAKLGSHQLFSESDLGITSFNFALKTRRHRKFLFGNSTRLSLELLGRTIVEFFSELNHEDPQREIIFVSHGTTNEIRILDDIGVSLEALPITGIVDMYYLARHILGLSCSLECLLTMLRIPARLDLLHCAGNDAHYTLQALLALLQTQYSDNFGQLERLARQTSPLQPCCLAEMMNEDRADHLELDTCLHFSLD